MSPAELCKTYGASMSEFYYRYDYDECEAAGGTWGNPEFYHFDYLPDAIVTLFQVSTMSGWTDIMYSAVDITEPGKAPKEDNHKPFVLYFLIFIVICSFFAMN